MCRSPPIPVQHGPSDGDNSWREVVDGQLHNMSSCTHTYRHLEEEIHLPWRFQCYHKRESISSNDIQFVLAKHRPPLYSKEKRKSHPVSLTLIEPNEVSTASFFGMFGTAISFCALAMRNRHEGEAIAMAALIKVADMIKIRGPKDQLM